MSRFPLQIYTVAVALGVLGLVAGCRSADTNLDEKVNGKPATGQAPKPQEESDPLRGAILRLLGELEDSPDDEGAQSALVALGEPVVPYLEKALASEDPEVRMGIVVVLNEVPGDDAFTTLLPVLGDANEEVRFAVAEALGEKANPRAVPALLDRYAAEDADQVRYEILTALGPIGDPATIPMLAEESEDEDPYVRMWSADALCTMEAVEAVDVATRLLGDPNKYVRRHILKACAGSLTRPDSQAGVLYLALNADDFDESVLARRNLQKMLSSPGNHELRGRLEAEAVPALEGSKAIQAAFVLADVNNVAGLEVLRNGVGDSDPYVRHHIAFELGRLGGPSSVTPLVTLLSDSSELVSATAYDALMNFADRGNQDAVKATEGYRGKKFPQRLKDLQQTQG